MGIYSILLWDADNTLLDFDKAEKEALGDCLREWQIPYDDQMIATYSSINDSYWKKLEKGQIEKSELKWRRFAEFFKVCRIQADPYSFSDRYLTLLGTKSFAYDGAETLCRDLFCEGYRLFIITNGTTAVQKARFNAQPLSRYFEKVFISDEIGARKPSGAFFAAVCSSIADFEPSKTLVIGDSLTSDVNGAVRFGLDVCWYNAKRKPIPSDLDGDITYNVSSYDQIRRILLREERDNP